MKKDKRWAGIAGRAKWTAVLTSSFATAFTAAVGALAGCAALEAEHQAMIDNSISITYGTSLENYRRVAVSRMECLGVGCSESVETNLTRQLEKNLTDLCYQVVGPEEYARYVDHFSRRLTRPGRELIIRTPQGALIQFVRLEPELREVLSEELQIDAVVASTVEIEKPDEVTQFRKTTFDIRSVAVQNLQTLWHSRLEGNNFGPESLVEDLSRTMTDVNEGIRRKASLCGLIKPTPASIDGVELVGEEIRLGQRIFFEMDKDSVSQRSYVALDRMATYLKAHPEVGIVTIEGHTDDIGDDGYNRELSARRAESVQKLLQERGVSADRLRAVGIGETRPLVPNTTEANRSRNRRVEFRINVKPAR